MVVVNMGVNMGKMFEEVLHVGVKMQGKWMAWTQLDVEHGANGGGTSLDRNVV